ncbi:hypothetical protein POVWA2_056320 [Plasmodium ovale wallikeri]|uniref:Uncharacterized protein n=1 Tax=Plasmodium ovale wallikeri TaxID=864142 RepID=A0A1A8ZVW1_PLAOA|nr:hypothetical protein POVWA1_056930 [Plasmodium ovale wallikeri]SBT48521.1 hypothetical protein POVWA2_056320 [Plasmodium ovale wallikeri]
MSTNRSRGTCESPSFFAYVHTHTCVCVYVCMQQCRGEESQSCNYSIEEELLGSAKENAHSYVVHVHTRLSTGVTASEAVLRCCVVALLRIAYCVLRLLQLPLFSPARGSFLRRFVLFSCRPPPPLCLGVALQSSVSTVVCHVHMHTCLCVCTVTIVETVCINRFGRRCVSHSVKPSCVV